MGLPLDKSCQTTWKGDRWVLQQFHLHVEQLRFIDVKDPVPGYKSEKAQTHNDYVVSIVIFSLFHV